MPAPRCNRAAGRGGSGGEPAGLLLEIRRDDPLLDGDADRIPGRRNHEDEPDHVSHESGGEQQCAGDQQEGTVEKLVGRGIALEDLSLDLRDGVAALRADQQHADETGEDDQRDGRRRADGVGDDDEKQGVGQWDEQQECEHPAQAHTPTTGRRRIALLTLGRSP